MRIILTSLAFAAGLAASPATAQPLSEQFSVSIAYGDLNVADNGGVDSLIHRVKARADQFCIGMGDSPLQQLLQAQGCRANFIQAAEQELRIARVPSGTVRVGGR